MWQIFYGIKRCFLLINLTTEMTENELYPQRGAQAYPEWDTYLAWEVYNLPWKSVTFDLIINQGIPRSRLKYLDQGMVVCWQHVSHIYIFIFSIWCHNFIIIFLTHWLLTCHTIILLKHIYCQFQSYFKIHVLAFKLQLSLTATSLHAFSTLWCNTKWSPSHGNCF